MAIELNQLNLLSVTQAHGLLQDVLGEALPALLIEGEVSDFSVNKNTFVFFDIKDKLSSLHCFMMASGLNQPIENGMSLRLVARPHITSRGQLSLTVEAYELAGEGSLKRAFDILRSKLEMEGLFASERKRSLPGIPARIGLVASGESAAYSDFIKILSERWSGVDIIHANSQVQGMGAIDELVSAIAKLNQLDDLPEVIVITRGGGSLEDLATFNNEKVVRAVAASRVPTMVAVGHERDISLAELVADRRASTPSNAAELLVPSKQQALEVLKVLRLSMTSGIKKYLQTEKDNLADTRQQARRLLLNNLSSMSNSLSSIRALLRVLDPSLPIKRGFVLVVDQAGHTLSSAEALKENDLIKLNFKDGEVQAKIIKL